MCKSVPWKSKWCEADLLAAKNRLAVEFTLVVELAVTAVFTVVEESKDMVSMVKTPISSLFIFGGLTSYSQHLWEFGADDVLKSICTSTASLCLLSCTGPLPGCWWSASSITEKRLFKTQLYIPIAERGKKWGKCQNNDWSLFDDERRECANTLYW